MLLASTNFFFFFFFPNWSELTTMVFSLTGRLMTGLSWGCLRTHSCQTPCIAAFTKTSREMMDEMLRAKDQQQLIYIIQWASGRNNLASSHVTIHPCMFLCLANTLQYCGNDQCNNSIRNTISNSSLAAMVVLICVDKLDPGQENGSWLGTTGTGLRKLALAKSEVRDEHQFSACRLTNRWIYAMPAWPYHHQFIIHVLRASTYKFLQPLMLHRPSISSQHLYDTWFLSWYACSLYACSAYLNFWIQQLYFS